MKRTTLVLACSVCASSAFAGDNFLVYFGTNTNAASGSKGIYVARFNSTSGKLTKPELAAEAGNPGFLAIHPTKKFLYAIGDVTGPDGGKSGGIHSFAINASTGELVHGNQRSAIGSGPCHVAVDATGRMVALANYGSGSVASYAIGAHGEITEVVSFIQHEGRSVDPRRQTGPHAHSVNFSPDNRFAFACDLGLDKVLIYKIDPATGRMTPNEPAFVKTPAGGGPRHLAFHPSGKFVFVNNEMGMTATVFAYDAASGAMSEVQTVSTLPEADRGKPGFSTAETLAHPNGKNVYVSNRKHDTIAVFACNPATGALTLIQNAPVEGRTPRNICLDPTGKWLIAAHQDSGTAALFKVDAASGKLSFTGTKVEAPGAICVRFLAVE